MRTCVVGLLFEGDTGREVWGVYRGPLRRAKRGLGAFLLNSPKTVQVARVEWNRSKGKLDLAEVAQRYATPEAPPVPWQGGE